MNSFRDLMRRLPVDGEVRDKLRSFNMAPSNNGKAKSVKDLAESLGFSVIQRPMRRGMSGRLVQDPFSKNGYCIEVNKGQSVEARRFAVLHEMGHFFLHADHKDPLAENMHLDRSRGTFYVNQKEETEANQFAAIVLFGDGALAAAASLYNSDISKLKRHFGVSETTIRIALEQFK